VLADLAEVLPFAGRPREALAKITKAIELNPEHPDWYLRPYAIALFFAGDYEQSARIFETWLASSRISKEYYVWLAAAWSLAGKTDRAKQILDEQNIFQSVSPSTLMAIGRRWPLAPEEQEIFFRGLRLSGVLDGAPN
jgi:tetratricopeptide (TPR) repeat protein